MPTRENGLPGVPKRFEANGTVVSLKANICVPRLFCDGEHCPLERCSPVPLFPLGYAVKPLPASMFKGHLAYLKNCLVRFVDFHLPVVVGNHHTGNVLEVLLCEILHGNLKCTYGIRSLCVLHVKMFACVGHALCMMQLPLPLEGVLWVD